MMNFLKNQNPLLVIITFAVVIFVAFEIYKYWQNAKDEEEAWEAYLEYQREVSKEQKRLMQEYKKKYGVDLNGK